MYGGFFDSDPTHWTNCDLCGLYHWHISEYNPRYCPKCRAYDPVSKDDVLDAHELLNRLTYVGFKLLVREGYRVA